MCKLCDDRTDLLIRLAQASSVFNTAEEIKEADEIINSIRADDDDFLSLSQDEDGKVSYAKTSDLKLDNDTRIRTTFGRYLRRRLKIQPHQLSDRNLAKWQENLFARITKPKDNITIVKGSAITDAYVQAYGGSSCMTGNGPNYVQLYAANPDSVSLVLYENGIQARALLWKTDQGATVLDRIYPNDGRHINALHFWAVDQGYIFRSYNDLPGGDLVPLSDSNQYTVTVKRTNLLPYMDTFTFAQDNEDRLILSNGTNLIDHDLILQSTDGETDGGQVCDNCNCRVTDDDHYSDDENVYCEECWNEIYSCCDDCEQYKPQEGFVEVDDDEYVCADCADSINECDECGYTRRDLIEVEGSTETYCADCVGEKAAYCDGCDTYHVYHNSKRTPDGDQVCEDCFNINYAVCEDCDAIIDKDDACKDENNNDLCKDCYETTKNETDQAEETEQKIA